MSHDPCEQPAPVRSGIHSMVRAILMCGCAALLVGLIWRSVQGPACPPNREVLALMVEQELAIYAAKHRGLYPEHLADLPRSRSTALSRADSWETPFIYQRLPDGGPAEGYVLISLGADGAPGGDDENADVAYWTLSPATTGEPPTAAP